MLKSKVILIIVGTLWRLMSTSTLAMQVRHVVPLAAAGLVAERAERLVELLPPEAAVADDAAGREHEEGVPETAVPVEGEPIARDIGGVASLAVGTAGLIGYTSYMSVFAKMAYWTGKFFLKRWVCVGAVGGGAGTLCVIAVTFGGEVVWEIVKRNVFRHRAATIVNAVRAVAAPLTGANELHETVKHFEGVVGAVAGGIAAEERRAEAAQGRQMAEQATVSARIEVAQQEQEASARAAVDVADALNIVTAQMRERNRVLAGAPAEVRAGTAQILGKIEAL